MPVRKKFNTCDVYYGKCGRRQIVKADITKKHIIGVQYMRIHIVVEIFVYIVMDIVVV